MCVLESHHLDPISLHLQVFLGAGLIVAMLQLLLFPGVVKMLGITIWQRIGCLVGVPTFLAASSAESLSWNGMNFFVVSVASTALIYCCNAMARALPSHLHTRVIASVQIR